MPETGAFTVTPEGRVTLGIRTLCEDFANNHWGSGQFHPEQAVEFALDQVRRTVAAELEMLVVAATEAIV